MTLDIYLSCVLLFFSVNTFICNYSHTIHSWIHSFIHFSHQIVYYMCQKLTHTRDTKVTWHNPCSLNVHSLTQCVLSLLGFKNIRYRHSCLFYSLQCIFKFHFLCSLILSHILNVIANLFVNVIDSHGVQHWWGWTLEFSTDQMYKVFLKQVIVQQWHCHVHLLRVPTYIIQSNLIQSNETNIWQQVHTQGSRKNNAQALTSSKLKQAFLFSYYNSFCLISLWFLRDMGKTSIISSFYKEKLVDFFSLLSTESFQS